MTVDALSSIDVSGAAVAIRSMALRTPLIRSDFLGRLTGGMVYLKLENLQRTGSFKVRGAAFRLLSLSPDERQAGVITCSSGNHGRAIAHLARRLHVEATVCVPTWVDPVKLEAIRREGAQVDREAPSYDDAERRALELGRERGLTFVHPFDDPHVLAGQGTLGWEVIEDRPDVDTIVAPLSGGGLVGGIAIGLRQAGHTCTVAAVSARNAGAMVASLSHGSPVEIAEEPTVASALSGGIGLENRYTFEAVRGLVTEHEIVAEGEIVKAMTLLAERHRLIVEGGGATGVAGVLKNPDHYRGKNTAVIVSGGNITVKDWLRLVAT